jgi:hypothetical protein
LESRFIHFAAIAGSESFGRGSNGVHGFWTGGICGACGGCGGNGFICSEIDALA